MPTSAHISPLCRRLLITLAALVATSVVCTVYPRGPAASMAIAGQPVAVSPTNGQQSAAANPVAPAVPSALPTPLRSVGRGCGLTLGASVQHVPASPAPVGRCTVVEIGDSLGSDLGWGLAREVAPASGLTLDQLDKSSTGLAVPSFYDWPAHLAAALSRYKPQLVVVFLGGNDQQGMEINGKPVQFGTTAWNTAYVARVRKLAQQATAVGTFVLWVGLPVMKQPTYDRGTQQLNADFQAGVAGLPRATYLTTRNLFAGVNGRYADQGVVAGADTALREPDGIHFSLGGEDVAATYVLQQIAAIYGVKIAPVRPALIKP